MLSSIHPLGERARHNRWGVTVGAFVVGSVVAGATMGAALGMLGSLVPLSGGWRVALVATAAITAGVLDLVGVGPPGPQRQVNERWIGEYRGWAYGSGFGAQLGTGVVTYVVTWGVYATLAAALLAGSWIGGAIIGGMFGAGRAATPLTSGWIDRPARLGMYHAAMARLARPVSLVAAIGLVAVGAAGLLA